MTYRHSLTFGLLAVLFSVSSPVFAEEPQPYYLTLGAVLESDFEFAGDLNGLEEEGSGYYIGAGKAFTEMFSLEVAYTDANDYSNNAGQVSEVNMIELSSITSFTNDAALSPYIRVGLYHANADVNNSPGTDETGFLYGVGLDYEFSEGNALRLDFTPGSFEGDDLKRLMIGLVVSIND